jgi:deferrochelatase/peroxidase EfeB
LSGSDDKPRGFCPFAHGSLGQGSGRRGFLASAGAGLVAVSGLREARAAAASASGSVAQAEPFWGDHQGGIATALQSHTMFASFDLVADRPAAVAALLRHWTQAAARLTQGQPIETLQPAAGTDDYGNPIQVRRGAPVASPLPDSGDALGLGPARLTLTFGFGAGLFERDGQDRYGLARRRPEALIDLPTFNGDQLVPGRTGGDLSVQACANDPQVAFHAIRQLANIASGTAQLRWTQTGFASGGGGRETPRNLMGFKDGTQNPQSAPGPEPSGGTARENPGRFEDVVWVGEDGPAWMRGGSYLVVRRIRIALEHWDRTPVEFQEEVVGRYKVSGAPLGKTGEFDPLDLDRADADGDPVIALNAHVRLATAVSNGGARMLRRGYSYNDGSSFTAERWPPWRQGIEFDAGLLFVCYQRDPRTAFVRIFDRLSAMDAMNQFVTHTGGALFACPRGAKEGEFIGQDLFETV